MSDKESLVGWCLGPWRLHVGGAVDFELDEHGSLKLISAPVGCMIYITFRSRIFVKVEWQDTENFRAFAGDPVLFSKLKELGELDYRPHKMQQVYVTQPYFHQLAHLLAHEAIAQRHTRDWPYDDRVYFQGDPIGNILYHLMQPERD